PVGREPNRPDRPELASRQLPVDDRRERGVDSIARRAADLGSRSNPAHVFGGPQRMPVGIEGLPRRGHGLAIDTEQAPAPLAHQVLKSIELRHPSSPWLVYEHMFASEAAAKVAPARRRGLLSDLGGGRGL